MRLNILVRNSVLGLALAGLMTAGAVQAQNKDAAKDRSNKGGQDAGNVGDERAAQVHAANQTKKKDKDRNPAASTNKTKGMHKAKGHSH